MSEQLGESAVDVERLAEAMHVVDDDVQFMRRDAAQNRQVIAQRVAAEYARLAAEPAAPEGERP